MAKSHMSQDSFLKGTWPPTELDGNIYAVPKLVYGDAVAYNIDLFRKYHVPFPKAGWTTKDFLRDAIALTHGSSSKEIWGVAEPFYDMNIAQLFGGQLFDYKKGKMLATDPRVERAVQFEMDLMLKYKVMPAAIVTPNTIDPFLTGKAAMDMGWVSYDQDFFTSEIGSRFKWGIAPFPADWHGVLQANYTAISQASTNKAAAWQFVQWVSTDPSALKILGQFSSPTYLPALKQWLAHPPAAWAHVDRAATIAAVPRSPYDYDGGVYTEIWTRFGTALQKMQRGASVKQTLQSFQQEGQQLIDRAQR
jgi:multiple sugar transport system substrate-binding protein